MGEFFGAVVGAVIPSVLAWVVFIKERKEKIDDIYEGANRESNQKISAAEIESEQKINELKIAFNKAAQDENSDIQRKLNELIEEKNKHKNMNDVTANLIEYFKTQQTDKWEQKKIDANLKATARINWIQKVREVTSDFISDFHTFVTGSGKSWIEIQKNIELLILHFGPEQLEEQLEKNLNESIKIENGIVVVSQKAKNVLLNKKSNKGKNDYLVKYILTLNKYYSNFELQDLTKSIKAKREIIDQYKEAQTNILIDAEKEYDLVEADDGMVYQTVTDVLLTEKESKHFDRLADKIKKLETEASKLTKKTSVYLNEIELLRDSIRIYLKIEWDIAKEGK